MRLSGMTLQRCIMSEIVSYIEAGFALIPVPRNSKGPIEMGWNKRSNAITSGCEEQDIKKLTGGNVGLAHAYCTPSPTCALDVDDYKLTELFLMDHGISLGELMGAKDAVQIDSGRVNRGKLLFRLPHGSSPLSTYQYLTPGTKSMVFELRCGTKMGTTVQDLLPPSIHPETNKPYLWSGKGHYSRLPVLPDTLLTLWQGLLSPSVHQIIKPFNEAISDSSVISKATSTQIALGPKQIDDIRSALRYLDSNDRKQWIDCGIALSNCGAEGFELWEEWSKRALKFDATDAMRVWNSFHSTSIDYKTIFSKAQRGGWQNPAITRPEIEDQSIKWKPPEVLPRELLDVPLFDASFLPDNFRAGVIDIAERLNCPMDFVAIPALVGAGALIGNKVGINPKAYDDSWIVYPALWGAIVGPPGSMKTPAQQSVFSAHYHLEEQSLHTFINDMAQYEQQLDQYARVSKDFKTSKTTVCPSKPVAPVRKRRVANDTTYQALGVILAENPTGILVLADELSGLLQSLDTPGQEGARGFYLSGWGGSGNSSVDRIGRNSLLLKNYCLSLFGGFQPDRLKNYVRQTQAGSSNNDGLVQRFQLIAWPDLPTKVEIIDRPVDQTAVNTFRDAMLALDSVPAGVCLHFTSSAQLEYNKWYSANEHYLKSDALTSGLQSHFAKYRSLIPGLALLFHIVDKHSGAVCKGCLQKALHIGFFLKRHARRIYSSVQGVDNAPMRSLAAKLIDAKLSDGFTKRDLIQKGWSNLTDYPSTSLALDELVARHWLNEVSAQTAGRPKVQYLINPGISRDLLQVL